MRRIKKTTKKYIKVNVIYWGGGGGGGGGGL
jgi:hypothetical protein